MFEIVELKKFYYGVKKGTIEEPFLPCLRMYVFNYPLRFVHFILQLKQNNLLSITSV